MCVRRYHLCTRKEAQVACRAAEGPRRLAPVSAGLLTVGHIGTVGPVGDCRGLPGLGETDGRVGACLGCPVLGLAKALGAGMLGLCHPSRSGAPPKNHSTRLRVLHSRSLVMSCISPKRGTKLWPCEGEGRCFSCRGIFIPSTPPTCHLFSAGRDTLQALSACCGQPVRVPCGTRGFLPSRRRKELK